jgi:hypothetical protein
LLGVEVCDPDGLLEAILKRLRDADEGANTVNDTEFERNVRAHLLASAMSNVTKTQEWYNGSQPLSTRASEVREYIRSSSYRSSIYYLNRRGPGRPQKEKPGKPEDWLLGLCSRLLGEDLTHVEERIIRPGLLLIISNQLCFTVFNRSRTAVTTITSDGRLVKSGGVVNYRPASLEEVQGFINTAGIQVLFQLVEAFKDEASTEAKKSSGEPS